MNKFVFEKSVSVKKLMERIECEFEFEGDGIYKVEIGSRGLVENVEKYCDGNVLEYMDDEEMMEMVECDDEDRESIEEFVYSMVMEDDGVGEYVSENWSEDCGFEYYWVRD